MKNYFNILLFLAINMLFSTTVSAQEKNRVYCELVGTHKFMSQKVLVAVDFGQNPYWNKRLCDENGKAITFNSMVDAMNYMGKIGWKFEQAYVVTTSNQHVYHWLLSKDITDEEEINEGFNIKQDFK